MMQQPLPQLRSRLCYDRLEAVGRQLFLLERVVGADEFLSAHLQQLGEKHEQLTCEALNQLMEDSSLLESAMQLLEIATLLAMGQKKRACTLAEPLPAHLFLLFQDSLHDEQAPLMLCAIGLAMAHSGSWNPSQEEIEARLDEAMEVLEESIVLMKAEHFGD